jgi:hypothetical protein
MQASTKRGILIVVGIVLAILLIGIVYVAYLISQLPTVIPPSQLKNPQIGVSVAGQNLLFYNNTRETIPYLLMKYNYTNITGLYFNATIFLEPVQRQVYLLNATGDCYNCGNSQLLTSSIISDLVGYGVVKSEGDVHVIKTYNLSSIAPNSTLIVINGYMPIEFFQNVSPSNNETLLQYLFNDGTAIIYVGGNFSYSLQQGPIGYAQVPTPNMPYYLLTAHRPKYKQSNFIGYYFDKPLYYFYTQVNSTGKAPIYGPMSYILVANGSLLSFPNFANSWNTYQNASSDIAKAAAQLFWLPKVSVGYASIAIKNRSSGSGSVGLQLNMPMPNYTTALQDELNSGYGRIIEYTNQSFLVNETMGVYKYLYYKPSIHLNSTFGIANSVTPGIPTNVTGDIFGVAGKPQNIGTSIYLYSMNGSLIGLPVRGPFVPATGNFTFVLPVTFYLWSGNYIATLRSFYGVPYASALVSIRNITIIAPLRNFKNNTFDFYLTSSGIPLNNVNYTITLENHYAQSGTITNGTIIYQLPANAPKLSGLVGLNLDTLNHNFSFYIYNPPVQYLNPENSKILYLVIVCFTVGLMVILVKAPNRDDFFIDIPVMTRQTRIPVSLTPKDILDVFDKQNTYFSWKFMPLSIGEIRVAIENNIKEKGSSVNLTMENIEVMLGQLVGNGYLEIADNLYAPKYWMTQSGYDMQYLATFKKLRIYMVANGYMFTDIGVSTAADITATHLDEKKYINIYSKTSKFAKMPIFPDMKLYLAFLNSYELEVFENRLYSIFDDEATKIKMYLDAGQIRLLDADNPADVLK